MAIRTKLEKDIAEGTTAQITATIEDESGTAIPAASLTTMILTLYLKDTPATTINSRSDQNVLNANNVVIDSSGNLTWTMQPADNAISDTNKTVEHHIALFEWTWSSGTKAGKYEIEIRVTNLTNV